MIYHVIANLELMFDSLDAAKAFAADPPVFNPGVPYSAMAGEDRTTPRICGARRVEHCMTAMGVTGLFRRCLNANPDAKSYENDEEAYPVLIAEFDNDEDWITPEKKQVPDVECTHEQWLLKPARPARVRLEWLDAYSIRYFDNGERTVCDGVSFLMHPDGYHHPWLDGQGHPLDVPCMGGDPWPDKARLAQEICLDSRMGGNLGFAVPAWPLDGRYLFQPFDPDVPPYKTYADSLKKFTGRYDRNLEPIFEDYAVHFAYGQDPETGLEGHKTGDVRYSPDTGWHIRPWDGSPDVPFVPGMKVLTGVEVYIGHGLDKKIRIPDGFGPPKK